MKFIFLYNDRRDKLDFYSYYKIFVFYSVGKRVYWLSNVCGIKFIWFFLVLFWVIFGEEVSSRDWKDNEFF